MDESMDDLDERTPLIPPSTPSHSESSPHSRIVPSPSRRLTSPLSTLRLSSSLPTSRLISTSPQTSHLIPSPTPTRRGASCRISKSEHHQNPEIIQNAPRRRSVNPSERTSSYREVEIEIDGCGGGWLCHPQRFGHRMFALTLMSLLGFGSYFCFDNPGALQREMKSSMGISTAEFANLYSFYSWPNVVLPVIGGFLVDRVMGMRVATVVFSFFLLIGQAVVALGGFMNDVGIMELGRFVFGIGGESLAVAQNTYAVSWFKGRELNMVFGIQLSIARVGSTVNFITMGPIYQWIQQIVCINSSCPSGIGWALLLAGSTCLMSFFCSIFLAGLDRRREQLLQQDTSDTTEVVKITDVKTFSLPFWLLCATCVLYYSAVFPFLSLGQDFFVSAFSMDVSEANFIIGLPYLISAPASPLLGLLVDKTGRNLTWCILAILGSAGAHLLVEFTSLSPYISISLLGLSYSLLASSLWPMATLMVPEYQLGTAYGIMQAMQNLGLALFTLAAGIIVDEHGYDYLEMFFLLLLVISLLCIISMWIYDCNNSGYLNMSVGGREAYDLQRMEEAEEDTTRSPHRLLQPRTNFSLRNRYLSRIGARIPPHLGHATVIVPRQFVTRIKRTL